MLPAKLLVEMLPAKLVEQSSMLVVVVIFGATSGTTAMKNAGRSQLGSMR